MAPTMHPITTVKQRLQQRGEVVHGHLDLLIVELADLLEHPVQGTGLLTDLDHLNNQGGNDVLVLTQRIGEGTALADAVLRFKKDIAHGAIAGSVRADVQRLENRNSRADQ